MSCSDSNSRINSTTISVESFFLQGTSLIDDETAGLIISFAAVEKKFPGDRDRLARMSLIEGRTYLCFDPT